MIKYSIYKFIKPINFCYIVISDKGLREISLGFCNEKECLTNLKKKYSSYALRQGDKISFVSKLNKYFAGGDVSFDERIDLSWASDFEKDVYAALRKAPYGKTVSYRDIAIAIGNPAAPRAVGNALGRNELPIIIPCHRVVNSNGALGGFSAGLHIKRFLLKLEGRILGGLSRKCL